jgi:5-methyltetrahydrofolate--homocysteine methyltransferase
MTRKEFLDLVQSRIVILDGSTGRNLQERGMPSGVCPEDWMLKNPQVLIGLQKEFLEAGTDILFAPTFTANRIKLAEYGLEDQMEEINKGLVGLSKKAIEEYRSNSKDQREIYIAADITMTGEQVEPLGTLSFEELIDIYKEQLGYMLDEGIDLIVVETMMSLQECRAALIAAKEICDLPVMISLTFDENGRTLFGTDPKTAVLVMQSMGAAAVGVNCSTGPDKMQKIIREMKEYAYIPVLAKPNAGIPKLVGKDTIFPLGAEEFAAEMRKLVEAGANIVGGCCGTTPRHMELMVQAVKNMRPLAPKTEHTRALTTERDTLEIPLDGRFMIVGERINPTGKKALQAELREGNLDLVSQMAEEQAELGADILDINMGMNGIDEKAMMLEVMQEALQIAKLPLCIDSSHVSVIEAALRVYPGRALINSISLEKEKFEKLIPIAKKYGAMFILLPLSDLGLPKDLEEKKQIIHTILDRALELGLTKEDIIIDGLVNTVGANKNAAMDAVQTIRYCKEELGIATIVGLSNISFGLPERQFVNSTFLAFAIQAGLTMAIANPSQDLLVNSALAADLLLGVENAADRYIERVTTRTATISVKQSSAGNGEQQQTQTLPSVILTQSDVVVGTEHAIDNLAGKEKGDPSAALDFKSEDRQVLFNMIVKGNRKNILPLVDKLLEEGISPDSIIEETLIPAINEVGQLYDRQIYFLPQLIGGAEAMKQAVDYLEPMLKKEDTSKNKITIVIATVTGDIHDIGKNLVTLMLKNYGYRVIDLGKDVPTEKILKVATEENADIIALSALMTTTMIEMKNVVEKAKEQGLKSKIIIGGAVVTQSYCEEIGADGYSEDAQSAVKLVKRLVEK